MLDNLPARIWDFTQNRFWNKGTQEYDSVLQFRSRDQIELLARFFDPPAWASFDAGCASLSVDSPATAFIQPSHLKAHTVLNFLNEGGLIPMVKLSEAFDIGFNLALAGYAVKDYPNSEAIVTLLTSQMFEPIAAGIDRGLVKYDFDIEQSVDTGMTLAKTIAKEALTDPVSPFPTNPGEAP